MSFNKITIMGNLGRDPELRYTPQGTAVCEFSVAVNEKRKDKIGELHDFVQWFKVTLWDKQAENAAKYLQKGSPVYIEGRFSCGEWTDRDGNLRFSLEVRGTDLQFVGGKESSGDNQSGKARSAAVGSSSVELPEYSGVNDSDDARWKDELNPGVSDDDIPF